MGKLLSNVQPAVKLETKHVAVYTLIGTILMWGALLLLRLYFKDEIPFDYTLFLGGVLGGLVAIANFFLMALTVQKVASTEDEKMARGFMKASFSRRMLMQGVWIVAAIAAPCFFWISGILPLLFPSIGIKIKGIIDFKKKNKRQEVEQRKDGD